jgi:hypothetical protein
MHSFLLDTIRRGSQRLDAPKNRESLMVGRSPLEEPPGAEGSWLSTRTPGAAPQLETTYVDDPSDDRDASTANQPDAETESAPYIPTELDGPPPPPQIADAPGEYRQESEPTANASPPKLKANAEPELPGFDPPARERPPVTHEFINPVAQPEYPRAADRPFPESNPGIPPGVPTRAEPAEARRVDEEPKINVALPKLPTPIKDPVIRIPSTLYERERSAYQKLRTSRIPDSPEAPGPAHNAGESVAYQALSLPDSRALSVPRPEPTGMPRALSAENHDGTTLKQDAPHASMAIPRTDLLERAMGPDNYKTPVAATDAIPSESADQPARAPRALITAPRVPLDPAFTKKTEGMPNSPSGPQAPAENVPKLKINSLEVRIVNEPPRDTRNRRRPAPPHNSGEAVSSLERNHFRSVGLLF